MEFPKVFRIIVFPIPPAILLKGIDLELKMNKKTQQFWRQWHLPIRVMLTSCLPETVLSGSLVQLQLDISWWRYDQLFWWETPRKSCPACFTSLFVENKQRCSAKFHHGRTVTMTAWWNHGLSGHLSYFPPNNGCLHQTSSQSVVSSPVRSITVVSQVPLFFAASSSPLFLLQSSQKVRSHLSCFGSAARACRAGRLEGMRNWRAVKMASWWMDDKRPPFLRWFRLDADWPMVIPFTGEFHWQLIQSLRIHKIAHEMSIRKVIVYKKVIRQFNSDQWSIIFQVILLETGSNPAESFPGGFQPISTITPWHHDNPVV